MLLGIFWKRFGTPTTDADSGTEHEFRRAYAAWQQHGRPQIMVYFNLRDPKMRSTSGYQTSMRQVLQFQEHFPREGLWWPYNGKAQFERLVRNHLTQFLRQRGPIAPAAPPTPPGHACLRQYKSRRRGERHRARGCSGRCQRCGYRRACLR